MNAASPVMEVSVSVNLWFTSLGETQGEYLGFPVGLLLLLTEVLLELLRHHLRSSKSVDLNHTGRRTVIPLAPKFPASSGIRRLVCRQPRAGPERGTKFLWT